KMELSRITGLVQNVLQVSLHDQAELKLNVTNVDLNLVLHELIDYYAIKTGDSVLLEIESSGSALVRADIYHISNVLYNLVDNAMNYSNRKPHSVSFKLEVGNDIILEIKDNGYGIPKSDQEKIFDKFHRVSQNGLHEVKGMGIGLYYAKTVMNKMRGDLKLKESSESGSTFCLSFQNADRESNG
ncbi:MAG: signal transduction histidine kinase, partial [Roseivirga sp.]